jgi:hypothetical protein
VQLLENLLWESFGAVRRKEEHLEVWNSSSSRRENRRRRGAGERGEEERGGKR